MEGETYERKKKQYNEMCNRKKEENEKWEREWRRQGRKVMYGRL